jgi:hypothetical protein
VDESGRSWFPDWSKRILVFLYIAFQGCGKLCTDTLQLITQIRDLNFTMDLPMV